MYFYKKKKTICLTNEFYPKNGGISSYTLNTAKTARLCRIDFEQWVPYKKIIKKKYFPFKIKLITFLKGNQNATNIFRLFLYLYDNKRSFLTNKLLITEPGSLKSIIMLNSIVCLKKCYIYLTLHGSEIIYLSSVIWKRFFLKILNNAKLIFVNSVFTKKILKFSGSLSISNNIVLLKPSKFLNFNEKIPLKFSISKLSNINLITVGRIHFRKGHVFTLNIVKNLSNYCTKLFIYNIVGPNIKNKYNYFLLKISNLINTQVVFKQNISLKGLNKEYLVSDIFVMLSLIYKNSVEGFGLVYSEAGLQKIPVIASLIGGTNDAVINKYTGFIFYKKEIHKFFKSILLLHKNTNSKLSLGFWGDLWSRKNHISWSKTIFRILF